MGDKSYVTMETAVCPICGKEEETGSILMDTQLRERFGRRTATGWALCAEHRAIYEDGYIALVAVSNGGPRLTPDSALRTGKVVHLRFAAARGIFNIPLDAKDGRMLPFAYCEPEVIDVITARAKEQGVEPLAPEDRPKA